jgi:hypothetical protein
MTDPSAATGGITAYLKGLSPKAKQYLVLGGLGMGFIGLVFGSIALWDKQPSAVPQTTKLDKSRNIVTPGAQVDPRDVWMSQSSQQMKEMDNVIQGLKQKLAEVEQKQATPQAPSRQASVLPPLPPMPLVQDQRGLLEHCHKVLHRPWESMRCQLLRHHCHLLSFPRNRVLRL